MSRKGCSLGRELIVSVAREEKTLRWVVREGSVWRGDQSERLERVKLEHKRA